MAVLALGVLGCSDLQLSAEEEELATAGHAQKPPGDPQALFSFVPAHLAPSDLRAAPNLVISVPTTIDTSGLTLNGATSPHFVRIGDNAVLFANTFFVQRPIDIVGSAPLIVVANDQATIAADIDLSAEGTAAGPGAVQNGVGGNGDATFVPGAGIAAAGGGGAGHGNDGASGGGGFVSPGGGGFTYNGAFFAPLRGGSPGGYGGFGSSVEGAPGGGGGALQISAANGISVGPVVIRAAGGGGNGGGNFVSGGGGGGSGGLIFLEAPAISVLGTLAANGGGGGGGGSGSGVGTPGSNGGDGLGSAARASGGIGGVPQGSDGGRGGAGGSLPSAGSGLNSKGGGGGGAAGRIWLRHRSSVPLNVSSATVSPPAGVDSSIP